MRSDAEEDGGPYFVDEKLNRSDLTTNTTDANVLNGIPLALTLTIMNYNGSVCSKLARRAGGPVASGRWGSLFGGQRNIGQT